MNKRIVFMLILSLTTLPALADETVSSSSETEESRTVPVDCSGNSHLVRIEHWDAKTRTLEVIDPACDGQGPFYSTPEVIGTAVPELWQKTDPKMFVNKTFKMQRDFEFHPTRALAVQERDSLRRRGLLKSAR